MKEYEIKAHLPSQMERLLNYLTEGDETKTENSIEIIKSILQDNGFNQDLEDYKTQLENSIESIENATVQRIKTDPGIKSIESVMIEINKTIEKVDEINAKYVKTIQTYIIGFISRLGEEKTPVEFEEVTSEENPRDLDLDDIERAIDERERL